MREATEKIGKHVGFRVEDDMVREMLRLRKEYDKAVERVHNLVRESDPVPLGSTHENLLTWITPVALSADGLKMATDGVNTLYGELQERVTQGIGVTGKGAPKILGILPCHHTDPRWEHLINELDMAIVAVDYELGVPVSSGVPETTDPFIAAVKALRGSRTQPLAVRVKLIVEGCRQWGIDGVLDHYHVGCRSVAGDAFLIRDAVQKELAIPVLAFEWENFDPRAFQYGDARGSLELFRSMMMNRVRS
jgi:benzoyl-CoA reductase/2-hydroxyglutaryl-CoA dehydratase subunit BcrC/BadD/HgdB